ncbi:hypothetical protein FOZ60_017459 [Perkinsus olseni]|uniref:Uncharacterized protein n=1 Tax=Perkinsus olseni TaxID=32597 RepID=A0A7J6N0K1_PEROL|nr:hypothetical protein FOZ60_017459 [Perkinsus olseni]
MDAVANAKQRMEELIQEHLRRNPRIVEPDGTADDWTFREALKKQFGILYDRTSMTWFYSLPDGRKRVKRCVEAGILDTLRVICEDKARRKKKRKPHEGARLSGPYSGTPSSASESSVSTRSADYRRGWKLRRRLSSLKCTNAGLRSIAAERLQRINELEAEKVAAWNPLRGAEDADGSEGAERSGPFPRVGPDQATVSMVITAQKLPWVTTHCTSQAELEKWKKRMEERKLAVEETERLRGHHNKKEAAMKDKLKTLRTETRSNYTTEH